MKAINKKLVIFDMDGTILDTLTDLTNSVNYALKMEGLQERTIDEVRSFVGNGIKKLIERAVPLGSSDKVKENVYKNFSEHYEVHCRDFTKPYEGITELIKELRCKGYKTAVVSNKANYAVQKLVEEMFDGLFDVALGETNGRYIKPDPEGVHMIMEKLGCTANESVYVGDSDVDIMTANNAGIDCIAVTWGFRERDFLKQHGAKVIVDSPIEILDLLE